MIELTDWMRDGLIRLAETEAPLEVCGLISRLPYNVIGSKPRLTLWRAENASQEPETSFLIDPDEQAEMIHRIWGRNEEVVGVFHSHPRSGPEPSERDRVIAELQPQGLLWVIVGLPRCFTCGGSGSNEDQDDCEVCEGWGYKPDFWVGELP